MSRGKEENKNEKNRDKSRKIIILRAREKQRQANDGKKKLGDDFVRS